MLGISLGLTSSTILARGVGAPPGEPSTPWEEMVADRYVDPTAAPGGNGLTPQTAYQNFNQLGTLAAGTTVALRADGTIHRPSTWPSTLTTVAGATAVTGSNGGMTFKSNGNPIITGAVLWTGVPGNQVVNGLNCLVLDRGVEINPFWFPRSDRKATFPSVCAPTANDAVDSFATNPADFDSIQDGVNGFRFMSAAEYAANVTVTGTGPYSVTIKAPGFWARANAAGDIVGYPVAMRNGTNVLDHTCRVTAYDPINGTATISAAASPASMGSAGNFFFALMCHPYGLRLNRQYAAKKTGAVLTGWIAAMASGEIDVACWARLFYFNLTGNITFEDTRNWTFEAICFGGSATAGSAPAAIASTGGMDGLTVGNMVARQIRGWNRRGGVINFSGTGNVQNVTVKGITQVECMGIRHIEITSNGITGTGNINFNGPSLMMDGAAGIRPSGGTKGAVIQDFVIAPVANVHDNGSNYYNESTDVEMRNGVIFGNLVPHARQVTLNSKPDGLNMNRRLKNVWLSNRPNLTRTGWVGSHTIRIDDGDTNGLFDRIVAMGPMVRIDYKVAEPNTGMTFQRSVLENVVSDVSAVTGAIFRHCVFLGKHPNIAEASVTAHLIANGATVENCVDLPGPWDGRLTDAMWDKLTLTADFLGHEGYILTADQLSLILPAYGSARTLRKPALVACSANKGHQAGLMLGQFVNPNPLATISLPAGLGDNDKFILYWGDQLIPIQNIPDQATLELVLRVTDAGASNGPSQDFSYSLAVERFQ